MTARGPILDERSRKMLSERMNRQMMDTVGIVLLKGLGNEEYEDWSEALVRELEEISDKVEVRVLNVTQETDLVKKYDIVSTPTILISPNRGYRIRWTGSPLGHEAWSFVETIVAISGGDSGLSDGSKKATAMITEVGKTLKASVFVTPTCPYCPQQVLLANRFAIETKGLLESECVEVQENPGLAMEFGISTVPLSVIFVREGQEWVRKKDIVGLQPQEKFSAEIISLLKSLAK